MLCRSYCRSLNRPPASPELKVHATFSDVSAPAPNRVGSGPQGGRSLRTRPSAAPWRGVLAATLLTLAAVVPPVTAHDDEDVAAEMVQAATRLLQTLSAEQRPQVQLKFDQDKRLAWHYIPSSMMESQGGRRGLALKHLAPHQRLLAQGLINTALSHRGHLQSMTIMALEAILRDLERGNPARDPEMYHVAIYGTPGPDQTWGWSFEGHHLSLNLTLVEGHHLAVTPSFFGSNPAVVPEGPAKGLDTLAAEQQLGRQLVRSLTPAQRKIAILSDIPPKDIVTGAQRAVSGLTFQPPQGIPFEQLDPAQQQLLAQIVRQFVDKYRQPILDQIQQRTPLPPGPGTFFAWAGGTEPGQGHYYRIQTPHFVFEYDNTQNHANHIHTVWRQLDGDFGHDLLREHYQTSPHHQQDR